MTTAFIYLPPDEMVVSPMPLARRGRSGKNAPNARLGASAGSVATMESKAAGCDNRMN
jgi:hypothetical protein